MHIYIYINYIYIYTYALSIYGDGMNQWTGNIGTIKKALFPRWLSGLSYQTWTSGKPCQTNWGRAAWGYGGWSAFEATIVTFFLFWCFAGGQPWNMLTLTVDNSRISPRVVHTIVFFWGYTSFRDYVGLKWTHFSNLADISMTLAKLQYPSYSFLFNFQERSTMENRVYSL